MPKPIQVPDVSQGVTAGLGVKGYVPLQLDETVVITVHPVDLEDSPYQRLYTPCGARRTIGAPGAGRFAVLGVRPSVNTILRVDRVVLTTNTAGTHQFILQLLSNAQVAALANLTTFNMVSFNPPTVPTLVGSQSFTADAASNTPGTLLGELAILNQGTEEFVLDKGISLPGNDPAGVGALCIVNADSNVAIRSASFICREYGLPG